MSLQVMADMLGFLNGEIRDTESRIRHFRYEADQLDGRLARLERVRCDLADQYEREAIAEVATAEPTGLGAVVRDREHRLWVRANNAPGAFPWQSESVHTGWSAIDAVEVLSEGVVES